MRIWPHINLKGDLFVTGLTFGLQIAIRLGSSLILTRILVPEAYGIITILLSVTYIIEMLSDIGGAIPIIRHKDGDKSHYLNTAWTLRLIRGVVNATITALCAPLIAKVYGTSLLITPLRVFSLTFILGGLESMAFPLAIRRKKARIYMYCEVLTALVATTFSVIYCYFSRTFWGMLFAILLNRALMSALSYLFYPEARPTLQFDREAARDLFSYGRIAMPSSLLTLALSQFDRIIFLRLFSLSVLGVYGLASNIAGSIESLILKISQMVLYPRCAHNFRDNRDTFSLKYYTENSTLFASILIVPAAVGGAARLIVGILYDPRYAMAGPILQALMVRAGLLAMASPAEDMLVATGETHIILVGNIFRAAWIFLGSLAGYKLFGLLGFCYGIALSGFPPLLYYLWLQSRKGMLMVKYEFYKISFICIATVCSYAASSLLLQILPTVRHRLR